MDTSYRVLPSPLGYRRTMGLSNSENSFLSLLVFFSAIISEIYHPEELAVARLSEAFGASPAKYIDFQQDNAAASITTNLLLSTLFMAFMAALF